MPFTVSVSARRLSAFGASHSLPYHCRMRSRAAAFADDERQHGLRPERGLRLLVRHELRRAAELAVLRLPLRVEHRDRVAARALDLALLGLPAAGVVGDAAQRADQVVLDDAAGRGVELRRRFGAAERADELLLCRIPVRLAAACGARELPDRGGFAPCGRVSASGSRTTRHVPSGSRSIVIVSVPCPRRPNSVRKTSIRNSPGGVSLPGPGARVLACVRRIDRAEVLARLLERVRPPLPGDRGAEPLRGLAVGRRRRRPRPPA